MTPIKKIENYSDLTFWITGFLITFVIHLLNGLTIDSRVGHSIALVLTPILITFIMTLLRPRNIWKWWIASSLGLPIGVLPFTIIDAINHPYSYDLGISSWVLLPVTLIFMLGLSMVLSLIGLLFGFLIRKFYQ